MESRLLVRDDVNISQPELNYISNIEFNNEVITNIDDIEDIMNLFYRVENIELATAVFPAINHRLRVHDERFPSIYYTIHVYQPALDYERSIYGSEYFLVCYDSTQVKIPNELAGRLFAESV